MINLIWQLLFKKEQDKGKQKGSTKAKQANYVKSVLAEAMEKHTRLHITMPGINDYFESIILGLDGPNGTLMLDELMPFCGHQLLLNKKQLHATASVGGVKISFDTSLQNVAHKKNIAVYQMNMPETAEYQQRRLSHRVLTHAGTQFVFRAFFHSHLIKGRVVDISSKGVGIILDPTMELLSNVTLPSCTLSLDNNENIQFKAQVKRFRKNPSSKRISLGVQFEHMSQSTTRRIEALVATLERQAIQGLLS